MYLKQHRTIHHREKQLKCEKCDEHFSEYFLLNQHEKMTHYFRCCGKKFPEEKSLKQHKTIILDTPGACKLCGIQFSEYFSVRRHTTWGECPAKYKYKCEHCGEKFTRILDLNQHRTATSSKCYSEPVTENNIKENYSEKNFSCEHSGEQFDGKLYLKQHRTMFRNSPEEDYSEKQFNVSDNVNEAEIKTEKKVSEFSEIKEETLLAPIKSNEPEPVVSLNKNDSPETVKVFQENYSEKQSNCKQCGK